MSSSTRRSILARGALAAALALSGVACQKDKGKKDQGAAEKAAAVDTTAARSKAGMRARPELPAPPDVAAPPPDAKKTALGVSYKVLQPAPAPGDKPGPNDTVVVHYTGWTTDGKMFDSSVVKKHPARFSLGSLIPGWTDGLQVMTVGEKTRLWIPEELAYKGQQGAPQGMLVFDVELQRIIKAPAVPPDVAAPPKSAKKTPKGVSYVVLTKGTGKSKPRAWDRVKVNYSGWTTDGKMFDSSVVKERPAEFALNAVLPGWTEGVQTMVVGQKDRLWIPEELAYKGKPGRPPGMLVFDIELLEIKQQPEPPPVPKDVAAPPKNAKKTEKGVSYLVLKKGTGTAHPKGTDKVKVHYSGWTTDGKMFDSSVTRGQPITFELGGVIPGWTDGLQTMVVGEKTRFWIPDELAYKGKPGRPQGMLVFDVELLEINPAADGADQD